MGHALDVGPPWTPSKPRWGPCPQIMYGLILSVIKVAAAALQVVLGVWMWIYMDCFVSLIMATPALVARPLPTARPLSGRFSVDVCAQPLPGSRVGEFARILIVRGFGLGQQCPGGNSVNPWDRFHWLQGMWYVACQLVRMFSPLGVWFPLSIGVRCPGATPARTRVSRAVTLTLARPESTLAPSQPGHREAGCGQTPRETRPGRGEGHMDSVCPVLVLQPLVIRVPKHWGGCRPHGQ